MVETGLTSRDLGVLMVADADMAAMAITLLDVRPAGGPQSGSNPE